MSPISFLLQICETGGGGAGGGRDFKFTVELFDDNRAQDRREGGVEGVKDQGPGPAGARKYFVR